MKPVKTVKQETKLFILINTQNHHRICGSEMQKAMNQKMEKQEYEDEYTKRSSVEGLF
ncbi:hypothetical protein [Methanobrevibacter sp.]